MFNLHAYFLAINSLSIFAQKQNVVLTVDLSQISITHLAVSRLGKDLECVQGIELFDLFSGYILNFCGQASAYTFKVHWYLELNRKFFVIFKRQILKVAGGGSTIDIVHRGDCQFYILQHAKGCCASIDGELGSDNQICAWAN